MKNNKEIGYKAFEKGLICKGKQYKENTVYKENGTEICQAGVMHYCKNPFDVLNFYPLVDGNDKITEFAEVEPLGKVYSNKFKSATNKLRIGKKLELPGFIDACINFALKHTDVLESEKKFSQGSDKIIIEDFSDINSNKNNEHIAGNGYEARITSSGDNAHIDSNGNNTQIVSSGDNAHIDSNGYSTQIASNGNDAIITSSGDSTYIASNGCGRLIASSGKNTKITSNGHDTQIASSGKNTFIYSSGINTQIVSSGFASRIISSGCGTHITSSGERSVVVSIGPGSIAKAKIGSWITLSELEEEEYTDDDGDVVWNIKCVKTEYVDGERIKEDTFYKLENGEFVEVK